MTMLVTYGSKRGGTEGLAGMVADALRHEGFAAEVMPAGDVRSLDGFDGVVVGGALYANRWHKDARRFVQRHTKELRNRPVYFFSSGPLDESAATKVIPPVKGVQKLMDRVDARDHATFGGDCRPTRRASPPVRWPRRSAGDWRDADHVGRWIASVAADLRVGVG